MKTPRTLPLLPLRDIVIFPHMVAKLFVGREKSISALDGAIGQEKEVFLATQKNAKTNDPLVEDIHVVGTLGIVVQMLRLPDGTVQVLVEGRRRGRVRLVQRSEPYFLVDVEELDDPAPKTVESEALMRTLQTTFRDYVKLNPKIEPDAAMAIAAIEEPSHLADAVAANLNTLKLADRQTLLETVSVKDRLDRLLELLQAEIEILQVEKKIRSRVKKQMERTQKEYYLNEQIQAIQKELGGDRDELRGEVQELEEKIKQKPLSKEAADRAKKELKSSS